MNSYVYAPKDDAKHRVYWREPYSVEESGKYCYFEIQFRNMPSGVMQCAVFTFVAVSCRASDRSYRERHVKWHTVCLCFISGTRRCVLEQQGDLATETEASAGIPKT